MNCCHTCIYNIPLFYQHFHLTQNQIFDQFNVHCNCFDDRMIAGFIDLCCWCMLNLYAVLLIHQACFPMWYTKVDKNLQRKNYFIFCFIAADFFCMHVIISLLYPILQCIIEINIMIIKLFYKSNFMFIKILFLIKLDIYWFNMHVIHKKVNLYLNLPLLCIYLIYVYFNFFCYMHSFYSLRYEKWLLFAYYVHVT